MTQALAPPDSASAPMVYVVDDDADLLPALLEIITASGWPAQGFSTGAELLDLLTPDWGGVILSDMRMPGMSGLELLEKAQTRAPQVPFILFTAHGDIPSAVEAIRGGAFDFLEKHAPGDYLRAAIRRALDSRRLHLENQQLRARIASGQNLESSLPGKSPLMRALRRDIAAIAPLDAPVLLSGEAGTGKAHAAMLIHAVSLRHGDYVQIDCATLTEADFDKVIQGATDQPGAGHRARDGTLHLARVSALPHGLQIRLAHLIAADPGLAGARLIGSVTGPLDEVRRAGQLCDDLYYSLSLAEMELPPLRRREDDIFVLLDQYIREAMTRHGRSYPVLTPQDLRPYRRYHWPGNLPELRNTAEKLVIGLRVVLSSLTEPPKALPPDDLGYEAAMQEFESSLLQAALLKTGGRKAEAAQMLGIPRKRLYLRLRACGLMGAGQN